MSIEHYALILLARLYVATLAPMTDERAELADEIAAVVDADVPMYRDDAGKARTLALHVAVAFREGSLRTSIVGDGGHSFCAFQIHDSSGGSLALTSSAAACAEAGHRLLVASARACRAHPVATYAEGPRGCESPRAQRISADRVALARRLSAASVQ